MKTAVVPPPTQGTATQPPNQHQKGRAASQTSRYSSPYSNPQSSANPQYNSTFDNTSIQSQPIIYRKANSYPRTQQFAEQQQQQQQQQQSQQKHQPKLYNEGMPLYKGGTVSNASNSYNYGSGDSASAMLPYGYGPQRGDVQYQIQETKQSLRVDYRQSVEIDVSQPSYVEYNQHGDQKVHEGNGALYVNEGGNRYTMPPPQVVMQGGQQVSSQIGVMSYGGSNGTMLQQQQYQQVQYSQGYQMVQGGGGSMGQEIGGEFVESWEADQITSQIDRLSFQPATDTIYCEGGEPIVNMENGATEQNMSPEALELKQGYEAKLESIDSEILRALKDPKNTKTVLSYENQVIEFVNSGVHSKMKFEQNANTYLKLLAHRIAQRFGLHTSTENLGDKRGYVVAEWTAKTLMPKYLLSDILNEMQTINSEHTNGQTPTIMHSQTQQQQQQQQPQYSLLQRRQYSEPTSPRYAMQQDRDPGLWQSKSAAARAEMYDQAKERIFKDSSGGDEGGETQQSDSKMAGRGRAILKNAEEERNDPDYQRYRNKQFDMGKMQAEQYNRSIPFDQHFPPLSQKVAHRSPSQPSPAQDIHAQAQRVAPHQMSTPHPGYYFYQQWPQYAPPMGHPVQAPPPGPYVQPMSNQLQPQMQMIGRGGMYATSPMQGHPPQPPHQMEGYVGPPLPPPSMPAPPQQLSPGQYPATQMPQQHVWTGMGPYQVMPNNMQGYYHGGPLQDSGSINSRPPSASRNQQAMLPSEIDGTGDRLSSFGEDNGGN